MLRQVRTETCKDSDRPNALDFVVLSEGLLLVPEPLSELFGVSVGLGGDGAVIMVGTELEPAPVGMTLRDVD